MQIQQPNLQNNQGFQGQIHIIQGDLSHYPAMLMRKSYNAISEMIKDKPYDLFIKQNHQKNNVSIIAQKEQDFIRKKGLRAEVVVSTNADIYEEAARHAIHTYDEKAKLVRPTFGQNCKKFFNKLVDKFLNIVQDKYEL